MPEKISGYDLANHLLSQGGVEALIRYAGNAETDWLELKAGMCLLPEDRKKGETEKDLYWNIAKEVIALMNTSGGALVIGIHDKTLNLVPLEENDPRHILAEKGIDGYVREFVRSNVWPSSLSWTYRGKTWELTDKQVPTDLISYHHAPYFGPDGRTGEVVVLLVKPSEKIRLAREDRKSSVLLKRTRGEVGEAVPIYDYDEFDKYKATREIESAFYANARDQFDREHAAASDSAKLDAAIHAYHAKLEEETRKKLRAFIPLDVEGDEPDEEDEEEFENPQAISVFDEDDDAWLNSNNKDGDTSDKSSTGSEVEDEAGDLDDDVEFEDDERETSKRTIKIGLYELLEQQNRVVLVGEPGAGKTTCLAHFAVQQGKMKRPRPHLFAFIALGRWVDGGSVRGLVEKTCCISQAQIDTLLAEKRLHLILDALNECPDRLRPGAIENIRILLRDHPDLPVVLSSRKAEGVKLSGIPVFEVQSMDTDRQRLFLERYLHDADAAQKILDSLLKQPGGASIAQNPMLLRMVVDVVRTNGDLPNGRASLYRRWLENWYAREEKKAKKAKDVVPWSKEESIRLLSQMAFAGRAEGYRDIPLDMARHSLGDKDGTFLDRLCQGPLLEIEEGFVHFRHETIQEYLCAEWLLAEPAALNSLPEKDYDTWGMPIAYAAELRLPNKLPDEMSEAVWELNPWVAALVAALPSRRYDPADGQRSELVLANAVYHKGDLLFNGLRAHFCKEIERGSLFKQRDPALDYCVICSKGYRQIWKTFECAYVLHMPSYANELFLERRYRSARQRKFVKGTRDKAHHFFVLSQETLVLEILTFNPDVPIVEIAQRWSWLFTCSSSNEQRERALVRLSNECPNWKYLPIELLSILLDSNVKLTGSKGKSRVELYSSLFGPDFIERVLNSISSNPSCWMRFGVMQLLRYARKRGLFVREAATMFLSQVTLILEQVGVTPVRPLITEMKSVYCLLDEADILTLMQTLSMFGRSVLKRLALNSKRFSNVFYEDLPDLDTLQFRNEDLSDDVRRRNIATLILAQPFLMTVMSTVPIILGNFKFPDGIRLENRRFRWNDARLKKGEELQLPLGSQWLVQVDITCRGAKYRFSAENIRSVSLGREIRDEKRGKIQRESIQTNLPQIIGEEHNLVNGVNPRLLARFFSSVKNRLFSGGRTPDNQSSESLNQHIVSEGATGPMPASLPLDSQYTSEALADPIQRQRIESELRDNRWEMTICRLSKHGGRVSFSHPSFRDWIHCPSMITKYADVFAVGQYWGVVVGIKKKKGRFLFVPESIEPSKENPACPFRERKPENKCANQIYGPTDNQNGCASPPVPLGSTYRKGDLSDSAKREHIKAELKTARWEMKVAFISEDRGYLFFNHPSFQDGVYCPAWSTQYQDVFEVGQVWNVRVCVKQNKKDGTFGFVARSVKPSKANPTCLPGNENEKPVITRQQEDLPLASAAPSESHISIYIDETWPGTQDHAYEEIGVIGGVVVPWEGVDAKRLPVVKTHLDNGSAARNAFQAMLKRSEVFPFVFPIKCDQAVGTGGRQYFELVQHALMLLLGWMLPQRDKPITVDVFLEHISGYMDGHNETDFINSLAQAMRLLSGGRRFANWQIRRVEWVDKEFGYVPYGDLVCKTCVPREEQQLLAREVKVREWEGFLPFSKDVFPLLRDMDTASPSGLADLLISFAKVAQDTPFFRRVRKLAIDRAKADEAVCTALISRFEECYARPDRDMALLNRVVPHFLNEFPPDLFKERPRLQLLRILIGFQHANHNGDPDLATALVGRYHSLRPRILELDRDLCAYSDLNLAVHHHDSFEFDKALSLVDGWINDPLFPALSVMNRGRMYSSRGQSLALLGRNQEADEAFARALSIFSAEPELLVLDIAQTKTYQAMNALDHDAPSAVPLVESLLGKSLVAAALDFKHVLDSPFIAHLFLKALLRMRTERSVVLDALLKNLPSDIAFRKQHPYEPILFYLALLTKEANPSYAKTCVREMEQFFEAIEFGGTLGLIHAYMRVMLKRHGLNVATDKEFFGELDIVMHYLPRARVMIDTLRAGWTDAAVLVEGLLPFNYC